MDPAEYCREIETYLCAKNEGHLVRIVGPAFEQVTAWAARGVPLKVAFRGIDRYCERYYAKGPRRRPVRIEFCEADILDAFDEWRRAVGVPAAGAGEGEPPDAAPRKTPIAQHLERAIARLATAGVGRSPAFAGQLTAIVGELDRLAPGAKGSRGDARARIIERLADLDRQLIDAALREVDPSTAERLRQDAAAELAPFGSRMPPDVRAQATRAAFERLVRESMGLPILAHD
jgi:hypothetical protein